MANINFKFCLFKTVGSIWGKHYGVVIGMLLVNECLKLSTNMKTNMFLRIKFNFVTEQSSHQGDTDSGKCSVPASFSLESIFRFF